MDTLAFGYTLPTTGRVRDFHPLETCAAGRTPTKKRARSFRLRARFLLFLRIEEPLSALQKDEKGRVYAVMDYLPAEETVSVEIEPAHGEPEAASPKPER